MRQSSKVEGTKIAQAAKDLSVTSVTIRRYLAEFNIDTHADENGIKVLPDSAMEELKEIRKLKEAGLTNPKVLELLDQKRQARQSEGTKADRGKSRNKKELEETTGVPLEAEALSLSKQEEEGEKPVRAVRKKPARRLPKITEEAQPEQEADTQEASPPDSLQDTHEALGTEDEGTTESGQSKHSLTCQTCGKVFEHMNPRLRDCLECYRAKRKERRRGGTERHKNVIQHPIAQQVANKTTQPVNNVQPVQLAGQPPAQGQPAAPERTQPVSHPAVVQRAAVRNYRKAIEETRQITGSLKRRLERPISRKESAAGWNRSMLIN